MAGMRISLRRERLPRGIYPGAARRCQMAPRMRRDPGSGLPGSPSCATGARAGAQPFQARTARVTLCPPNPKELESATSHRAAPRPRSARSRGRTRGRGDLVDGRRDLAGPGHQQRRRRTRGRRRRRAGARSSTWWSRRSASGPASPKTALTAAVSAMSPCVGGGAVRVDVADAARVDAAVRQAVPHGALGALAVRAPAG